MYAPDKKLILTVMMFSQIRLSINNAIKRFNLQQSTDERSAIRLQVENAIFWFQLGSEKGI